jgi:DNA-binding SARP family transcriptional activator/tetratricopeptide (TPR) repeat protein
VEVESDDGRVHTLTRRQERDVLAVLLLNPGRVTPVDRLVALVWNDNPPGEPRRALQSHVSRIRRLLTEAGAADYDVALASPHGGYLLSIDPDLVDAHRFRRLLTTAGQSIGLTERDRLLREALALWHGPTLNRPSTDPLRQRLCTDLDELHLQAQEQSLATRIDLGHHHELLADLAQLSIEHPTRQRLTELHMRALHLDGRTADALDVYRRSRDSLADTLGIDPDPALQDLHTAILRGEVLVIGAVSPTALVIPAQLPVDPASFAGRTHHLDRLDALVPDPHNAAGTTAVVITTIDGTAGVGKTALAVHWAHRVVGQFPDGQLYVNLRGFDPGGQAMDPASVVRAFLDALDVPPARIPTDPDAQTALYRSLLVDKRALIVLDNARDSAQVRPLLPGAPGCLVVITSRNQLTSLVAETGAHPLTVDLLTELEARELLIHRLGPDRVAAEPDAVTEIITRCARLPIALTLVAAHAALRPHAKLRTLAEQLCDSRQRWRTLAGDDPSTDVQSLFSWSYHTLTPAAARLFRLLGLHPGPDIGTTAAASLADLPLDQVRPLLTELARANLINEPTPGRYALHDLLREYAGQLANGQESDRLRRAALTRLFDHCLHTAASAMDTLYPAEADQRPRIPPPTTPTPDLTDPDTARAWLDTERATLVAVAAHTAAHGWPTHTTRLSAVLLRYLSGGYCTDALTVHGHANQAAQHTGDLTGQAEALTNLGAAYHQLGRYGQAAEHFQQVLRLSRRAGDPLRQARTLNRIANVESRLGRYRSAAGLYKQALALFRQTNDRTGEAWVLSNLGTLEARQCRWRPAADRYKRALTLRRQVGDRFGEAWTLNNLGEAESWLGYHRPGAEHLQQALALFRQLGNRTGEALTLDSLGTHHTRLGQPARATEYLQQAVAIFREAGDREHEAVGLNSLGEAAHAAGDPTGALTHHTAALTVATDIGDRDQQARAHTGLGHAHHTLKRPAQARHHYQSALTLYTALGLPQADQIRTHLATLGGHSREQR